MGPPILIGFGIFSVAGIVLVVLGAIRRARTLSVLGWSLLIGIAGAWIFGLPGAAAGLLVLAFLRPGTDSTSSRER